MCGAIRLNGLPNGIDLGRQAGSDRWRLKIGKNFGDVDANRRHCIVPVALSEFAEDSREDSYPSSGRQSTLDLKRGNETEEVVDGEVTASRAGSLPGSLGS